MSQDQTQTAQCNQMIEPKNTSKNNPKKTKQKTYKLGFVYLSPNAKRKQHLRLFPAYVIKILQDQQFNLPYKIPKQQLQIWYKRFSLMVQTNFIEFNCGNRNQFNQNILSSIQHIKFNQLKYLNLFDSRIQNIQPLSYLNVPCIQRLNLIYNQCYNFSSLVKLNTPNLKQLCLYIIDNNGSRRNNQFTHSTSIDNIGRWSFNLIELRLQKHSNDQVIIQDFCKLSKLKTPALIYNCIVKRIDNKRVNDVLKEKSIKFFSYQSEFMLLRVEQLQFQQQRELIPL